MKSYTITITQTEVRTWTLLAESEEEAVAKAEAWNEDPRGDCPEGALDYTYSFDSDTVVEKEQA